jgi:ribose transport system ATP-binding protein
MADNSPTHRLELRSIRKYFGATRALDGVDMEIAPGEVHAVIGENGAGKSTLMKVLSGAHAPDSGEIFLDGVRCAFRTPRESQDSGIAMIYQELNLAPELSVAENITLGCEPTSYGWISSRDRDETARDALARLNCDFIPLNLPVSELSLAHQQMVEIARSVQPRSKDSQQLKLLILDEPTSSLTKADVDNLFSVIERLKGEGVSLLYISHFLEECERVADRFTVLRDGQSVGFGAIGTENPDATPMNEIIHLMVGREMSDLYPQFDHQPGEAVLKLESMEGLTQPKCVNLTLRRGEIFGLAGLIGAGRTETVRTIFGLNRLANGRVIVHGNETSRRSPCQSWQNDSMGLVSEDRKNEGLLLNRSLVDNLTLTKSRQYCSGPFLQVHPMRKATEELMAELDIRASDCEQPVGELSGGNQQKIAFGRLLHHDCEILLLDEPTRGIDIGSKNTIYRAIGRLAAAGKAILMISSYLPELLGICDTIGVFSRGKLVETRPKTAWDAHSLLVAATDQTG